MEGLHILANFYQCHYDFSNEDKLLELFSQFCTDSGLQVVGKSFFHFSPQGLTFALLLAESHLSIHTWPETGNVAFDLYTCNYQSNNNDKTLSVYHKVKDTLKPHHIEEKFIQRAALD